MKHWLIIILLLFLKLGLSFSQKKSDKEFTALVNQKIELEIKKLQYFDDFINKFSFDSIFQKSRIIFPLIIINDGKTDSITKSRWIYKNYFIRGENELLGIKLYNDSTFSSDDSVFRQDKRDLIFLDMLNNKVNINRFTKNNRFWFLAEIENRQISNKDGFIKFLIKFINDSAYQLTSINFPLQHKYIDTNGDDFPIIKDKIEMNKWVYLSYLKNIINDKQSIEIYNEESNLKLMIIYGLDCGIHDEFLFKFDNGKWKLIAFNELSM